MKNRIRLLHVQSASEAADQLKAIGVEPYGIASMAPKMRHLNVLVEGMTPKVANIIKQEMLSQGGDAAVSRGCVDCSVRRTDVLIMGTVKQILRFADKLRLQPFGLKDVSADLRELLDRFEHKPFLLETPRRKIRLADRTLIMGVINMTPDSFSDGGAIADAETGLRHAVRLIGEGADILDVGGESSRPGAKPVPAKEELRRVIPLIRLIARETNVPVSVDTAKSEVARRAVDAGAEIVNDITALRGDRKMARVAADAGAAVILMHMRGRPRTMQKGDLAYRSLLGEILRFLADRVEQASAAGVSRDRLMVDPGIGFGKSVEDNLRLLRHLEEFKVLGRPVCVGVSRKHFTGKITGVGKPQERLEGTAAAVTAAILNGADIVRVHDVAVMKRVAAMADALRGKR